MATSSNTSSSSIGLITAESIFGLTLTTYRDEWDSQQQQQYDDEDGGEQVVAYFPYECWTAAIAVAFFRMTIKSRPDEPLLLRLFFSATLASMAYLKQPYAMIGAIEMFSFMVPYLLTANVSDVLHRLGLGWMLLLQPSKPSSSSTSSSSTTTTTTAAATTSALLTTVVRLLLIALSAMGSLVVSHVLHSDLFAPTLQTWTPTVIQSIVFYMIPIAEMQQAYDTIALFVDRRVLQQQFATLLFVTFHIQFGMGHLGIDFLTREQTRRNDLVRLDMSPESNPDQQQLQEEEEKDDNATAAKKTDHHTNGGLPKKNGNGKTESDNATMTTTTTTASQQNETGSSRSSSGSDSSPTKRIQKQLMAAKRFQKSAAPFILFAAAPYMLQMIVFGNMNFFAYTCFENEVIRAVRLDQVFAHDSHLLALSKDAAATSPNDYASAMSTVISTTYELFNRKLFSLPKLLLLPSIVMRQPLLVVQMTPFIFGSDYLKAKVMAYLTTNIERLKKEKMELEAVRTKVESFDLKNAELLQRSGMGATSFTRHTWHELTVQIQQGAFMESFVTRTKGFFNWIQHHFVFSVMVDCALAQLIAVDKIQSAEIFVFSRAIEDAVDTVLMKSRAESELARMMTQMERLQQLSDLWQASRDRELLPCRLAPQAALASLSLSSSSDANVAVTPAAGIVLKNLHYSRGSAVVDIDHIDILPGVYALTGANGSGKSTLFRVLMSCSTNEKSTDLPVSIVFSSPALPIVEDDDPEDSCSDMDKVTSAEEKEEDEEERLLQQQQQQQPPQHEHHPKLEIVMPSSDVSEISQTFYWPLYTRPIDWIFQKHLSSDKKEDDIQSKARRVAELLQDLEFRQIQVDKNKVDHTDAAAAAAAAAAQSTKIASSGGGGGGGSGDASTTCMPVDVVMEELLEEKEDWFNDLSGGQKSKVELVRKVFIRDKCPSVLLIDETMAPLDPTSKSLVMAKLKAFCQGSVVIVIYHTDVMASSSTDKEGGGDGESYECVPGNNFFDANLHLENRALKKRQLC